jgi:predicted transcriptional regulator
MGGVLFFRKDLLWSYAEVAVMWELSKKGMPLKEIAVRVGKTEEAVRTKAKELGIELKEELKEKGA